MHIPSVLVTEVGDGC